MRDIKRERPVVAAYRVRRAFVSIVTAEMQTLASLFTRFEDCMPFRVRGACQIAVRGDAAGGPDAGDWSDWSDRRRENVS